MPLVHIVYLIHIALDILDIYLNQYLEGIFVIDLLPLHSLQHLGRTGQRMSINKYFALPTTYWMAHCNK